ncbi:hypothetical protein [Nocardioides sp. SYSU D00038]|uniref:hypothetical protein n=1 Tax=Nocardioides sp. SYSU D00038 TaxID=2812554 RepID=UPI0019676E77|nr:hypothetical protein [Nocardioides sp. SYSU D00038]
MTWKSFHNRGEILRDVIRTADRRRDGVLPMDVPGVAETFGDELTLLGALSLRWHTRLSGRIERELVSQPMDLERAVQRAWQATADELPGIRRVLDHHLEHPLDDAMASALAKAQAKEHLLLAVMAGQGSAGGSTGDAASVAAGRRIEAAARASYLPVDLVDDDADRPTLLARLRAVLAA